MKHPLHYLCQIFLLLLIITVSSCEKEELTEEPLSSDTTETIQPEVKISTKPLAQFIEEDAKFKRSYSKFTSKRKDIQLKEGSDFEANPSQVIKVEDSGKTTYTVSITKEDTPIGTFENLVIDVDEDETMQTYILSYIPDAEGIVEFKNDSVSFKGTMRATPIDYDASDLLSQRHAFIHVTIMYCDVYGTTHLAGPGCTGAYGVTFSIPLGSVSSVASGNNNGITIVGSQSGSSPGFGGGGGIGGGTTSVPIMDDDENIVKKRNTVIAALKLNFIQRLWVNDSENNEDVEDIYTFLGENQFSDESTDFAQEAIDVWRDGYEVVSIAPLVKYPKDSNYEEDYKKLTKYLKEELPKLRNNQKIIDAIKEYVEITDEVIIDALTWGQGPIIEIQDLGDDVDGNDVYGKYKGIVADVLGEELLNTIFLDIDLVNKFENSEEEDISKDALGFLIGVTILHEYIHLSDFVYQDDFWGIDGEEEGDLFEESLYGQKVLFDNYEIIFKNFKE